MQQLDDAEHICCAQGSGFDPQLPCSKEASRSFKQTRSNVMREAAGRIAEGPGKEVEPSETSHGNSVILWRQQRDTSQWHVLQKISVVKSG